VSRPGVPGFPTAALTIPAEGIRRDGLVLRLPEPSDHAAVARAMADPAIRIPGNMPELDEEALLAFHSIMPAAMQSGRLMPLVVEDEATGELLGGGALHHLDAETSTVQIGYWLLRESRGRGIATKVARLLAEHAFSIGIQRVEARVDVGNDASDRVAERAGFTREGVLRSVGRVDGSRTDRAVWSLLPGE
jgi:RimJ/RimL family protein N-acetyltransferase